MWFGALLMGLLTRRSLSRQTQNLAYVLTDQRYHPLEYMITTSVRALPMFMLGSAIPTVIAVDLLAESYTKFYHGNVRTNQLPLS